MKQFIAAILAVFAVLVAQPANAQLETIPQVQKELNNVEREITEWSTRIRTLKGRSAPKAKRLAQICKQLLRNLKKKRKMLSKMLSNLQKVKKIQGQLGPIGFTVPTALLSKQCRMPVVRFIRLASSFWMFREMQKRASGKKMKGGAIIEAVSPALLVQRIGVRHQKCFLGHHGLLQQHSLCMKVTRGFLQRKGLRRKVHTICSQLTKRRKRCYAKAHKKKKQGMWCDMLGRAIACNMSHLRTWLKK